VPVEAYNSIGKVERYYTLLRRAYKIIRIELKEEGINNEVYLQIAVKAINNTASPNSLVPTLLVFGAYPRMTLADPPAPSIIKRSKAIQDIIRELRSLQARRKVMDALQIRNGPNTDRILDLLLLSKVITYREKGDNGKPR
jgi:hypothetical protein